MKKSLIYFVSIVILVFAASCTTNDSTPEDPPEGSSAEQYYPGKAGSTYNYEGETTDSSGSKSTYTRSSNIVTGQTENNLTYLQQNNVITVGPLTTSGDFLFRTSSTGMFIFVDPTVFTEILDSSDIDPSLVTLNADQEIRLMTYPFAGTPTWDAFIVRASALGGLVNLNLLEVKGNYRGQEQVTVMQQSMTAEKIEYIATIKIPESIEDIANPNTITVTANAWFAKDVGLVKLEGAGFLINVLGGTDISFEDDGSTATELLVNYNIQ